MFDIKKKMADRNRTLKCETRGGSKNNNIMSNLAASVAHMILGGKPHMNTQL